MNIDKFMCGICDEALFDHPTTTCARFPEDADFSAYFDFVTNASPKAREAMLKATNQDGVEIGAPTAFPEEDPNYKSIELNAYYHDYLIVEHRYFEFDEVPYEDYSGNEANPLNYAKTGTHGPELEDLADYTKASAEAYYRIQKEWYDSEPNHCTKATHWWRVLPDGRSNQPTPYKEPKTSVTVTSNGVPHELEYNLDNLATDRIREASPISTEVIHGFTSKVLIDPDYTDAFQKRTFNFYVGRDGMAYIGSCVIDVQDNGWPKARCLNPACKLPNGHPQRELGERFLSIYCPENPTRSQMEKFVTIIISHGNNHAKEWITSRPDFTYFHAANCDTEQHTIHYVEKTFTSYGKTQKGMVPVVTPCNALHPRIRVTELNKDSAQDCYQFLKEHAAYCKSADCTHAEYESLLWDELFGKVLTDAY